MKLRARDFLTITAISLVVATAFPSSVCSQQKSARVTLTGGVEHSDLLLPVPDDLKSGATLKEGVFDTGAAPTQNPAASQSEAEPYVDCEWYRVPKWLTGTWQREDVTRYYHLDYKTGKEDKNSAPQTEVTTSDYGYLPDSKDDVWDAGLRSSVVRSDFGPTFGISHISSNKLVSASDNQVIMESKGTLTVVSKNKNRIVSTNQCEAIRTIMFVSDGSIAVDSSQKDFDENGRPLCLTKIKFSAHRSALFDPSRGIADKRMVSLFAQFLLSRYWSDLLPGYYYASQFKTDQLP